MTWAKGRDGFLPPVPPRFLVDGHLMRVVRSAWETNMIGIQWAEFTRMVERNKLPWRQIKFYPGEKRYGEERTFSIYDFTLPRRNGTVVAWGQEEKEWERDSFVCNVTVLNNYIPYLDSMMDNSRPLRGFKSALRLLLADKVVRDSSEVRHWMQTGTPL